MMPNVSMTKQFAYYGYKWPFLSKQCKQTILCISFYFLFCCCSGQPNSNMVHVVQIEAHTLVTVSLIAAVLCLQCSTWRQMQFSDAFILAKSRFALIGLLCCTCRTYWLRFLHQTMQERKKHQRKQHYHFFHFTFHLSIYSGWIFGQCI